MKIKHILILIVLASFMTGGYFIFSYLQNSNKYNLTLQSELNPFDFHIPGTQTKEIAETYNLDSNWYHVQVMEFIDINTVAEGISRLKETYNPGLIILDKKYVNYTELSPKFNFYFYQSGKYILVVDMTGDKNEADSFVKWYYSKYPNK